MSSDYNNRAASTSTHNQKTVSLGEPVGVPKQTYTSAKEAYKAWLARRRATGNDSALMLGSYQRRMKKRT